MVRVGLIGLGTIGTGVVKVIQKGSQLIKQRSGVELIIKTIGDKDIVTKRDVDLDGVKLTIDVADIIDDDEIDVVVELIGGYEPARTFILAALRAGKHVVTANKAVMSRHGEEILTVAEENNVRVLFEASVGGCIPILRILKGSLVSENILSISGIINGTTNYILTKMTYENQSYDEALKGAQELGFAEADPRLDVDGVDSSQKLAILASVATGSFFTAEDVETEGITGVTPESIRSADKGGKVIKLLARFENKDGKVSLSVKPTLLEKNHPLATVNDERNAVLVVGDNIGEMMLYGKGAGQLPTASAVVADIIELFRD